MAKIQVWGKITRMFQALALELLDEIKLLRARLRAVDAECPGDNFC
ncbi:MAG: hypothetical protein V3T88_04345 [Nitrosomonadaceae bacterium]